jgi:hypothetical protein
MVYVEKLCYAEGIDCRLRDEGPVMETSIGSRVDITSTVIPGHQTQCSE